MTTNLLLFLLYLFLIFLQNDFNALNGLLESTTPQKPILSQTPSVTPYAPILDDLFSELTQQPSDDGFDLGSVERRGIRAAATAVPKSEPVDLADMERILLQPPTRRAAGKPERNAPSV